MLWKTLKRSYRLLVRLSGSYNISLKAIVELFYITVLLFVRSDRGKQVLFS